MSRRHAVVLLPGSVLPAEPAYTALLEVLGDGVSAVAKDLEVYAGDRPQPDYSLETEVERVLREADVHGLDRSISSATRAVVPHRSLSPPGRTADGC